VRLALDKNGQPKITEKVFQAQVRKAALLTGWMYYATWNSFRSPEGFPDIVLVHPKKKRLLIAELKSENGNTSPKQDQWLNALALIPCAEVHVVRPSDWEWFWKVLSE